MPVFIRDLDAEILRLGPCSTLDVRTLLCSIMVWGVTGGGKTSAAKALRAALLRMGAGICVFVVKPEEYSLWCQEARANGRQNSLIVVNEQSRLNFLDWLVAKYGIPRGLGTITDTILRLVEAIDVAAGGVGGVTQESFWAESSRALLSYTLTALYASRGRLSVPDIVAFVNSAAPDAKQYLDPEFAKSSFAACVLRKMVDDPAVRLGNDTMNPALEYFLTGFTSMSDRMRSSVIATLTSKLDRFVQPGLLRQVFCAEETNVVPECLFGGGILLLNFPVLTYGADGVVAQHLIKLLVMLATQGRNALEPRFRERVVVLYADEAHQIIGLRDSEWLATSRGSRATAVLLSQNIPAWYAKCGENKIHAVNSLLGQAATHIFHLNSCPVTNEWASRVIGKALTERGSRSNTTGTSKSRGMNDGGNTTGGTTTDAGVIFTRTVSNNSGTAASWGVNVGDGTSESASQSFTEHMENVVEPSYFADGSVLKSGGPKNRGLVTALMFRAGAQFKENGGRNTILLTFKQ